MASPGSEFKPTVPRDEPLTTKGHQPGQQVGNDAVPEFHAKTLPPGTAPKKDTYTPNPDASTTASETLPASASDTLIGSTSGDVHQGLGYPGDKQLSSERPREKYGPAGSGSLEGVGDRGLAMAEGETESAEAKRLQSEHKQGPKAAQEHNATVEGAEDKVPGREELQK